MRVLKKLMLFGFFLLVTQTIFSQGNTNSAINGEVVDGSGLSVPGATVVAIHTPSGSKYGGITDFNGYFRIANMRVGGPYTITFSYVGMKTVDVNDIYLQLGDSQKLNIIMYDEVNALQEIVVTGTGDKTFNSNKTGAQTIIDAKKIQELPSLSRNIADFARLTPQAQIRNDDVISIAGQNNRYNAIYIDGAVNNDVFGLSGSGTNGGQTGVSPISLDAIEQFQVQVAPFDVKISGFAGGAISAITKSGTNDFEGSAYFLNRNQNFAGMTPPDLVAEGGSRTKLGEFNASTIGVRAGGAIKKDKLFYFINYERQDNETPQPFDINGYLGTSGENGQIVSILDNLRNELISRYGYDPGIYTNKIQTLISDKLIAKVDWNINNNHKFAIRHSYVKAEYTNPSRTSATSINFQNGSQLFESITNSTAIELNSRFGNKLSNNLVVGYTTVNDDRDPQGNPFPTVQIQERTGVNSSINFGADSFSTANLLDQNILTITDNFEINAGKHNFTIGTHNEFSYAKNVFFRNNFGNYRFSSLSDFLNGNRPNLYQLSYSLVGGTGDDSQGAAEFNVAQFGFYLQDEFKIVDNFKLTYGIRADMPVWDDYIVNEDFNNRTIPLLEAAGKDLQGATVGARIKTQVHLSPRLGFNYDVNGNKKTQIRGGVGVFTSRLPLVWPGGAYNNNGVTNGSVNLSNAATPFFNPNPNVDSQLIGQNGQPIGVLPGNPGAPGQFSGQIDLFEKNFRLPQVFKASIAVDQKLPYGILFSGDFVYNDNISAVKYENLNLKEPTRFTTGADVRPIYDRNDRIDPVYRDGIFLGTNTSEGKAWNTSFTLSKTFRTEKLDVLVQGTYAYGESTALFDATSAQNNSQWNNIESVNGSNRITDVARSDFAQGNRILGITSLSYKWNDNLKTTLGLFYEGAEGTPFSYVYDDRGRILNDTGFANALIFVPADRSQIALVDAPNNGLNADQQWEALNAFIEGNDYLRSRRGTYAERNGDRLKWSHVIDLKFAQEFTLNVGKRKHTFALTADIFNFTNLLNKDWGKRYFVSFDQVSLITQRGFLADGTTPTFNYDPNVEKSINQIDDLGLNSARWQMQAGLRYTFN